MDFTITKAERAWLLAAAGETIRARLLGRAAAVPKAPDAGNLLKPCGAFVTIHAVDGSGNKRLRGCIGRMIAAEPLEKTVRAMAVEAAFGDPRFRPLRADEADSVSIEISVLSPMTPCPDPEAVTVGVHGVYLIRRGRAGVLLPQVPVEQGWNKQEYLDYISVKAGLPPGSWYSPDAERYVFTAVVFSEDDEGL